MISLQLPEGAKFPSGIGTAMDEWTAKNPTEAAAWLQQNAGAAWWPRAALGHVKQLRKDHAGDADKFLDALDDDHRNALKNAADEK